MIARTGTARAAAANFRNTTVSRAARWGRDTVRCCRPRSLHPRPGATLAWAGSRGQPYPAGQRHVPSRRARELTGGPVPAVCGRGKPTQLEKRDRAEHRGRLVAGRGDELVEAAETRDERRADVSRRRPELDQDRLQSGTARLRPEGLSRGHRVVVITRDEAEVGDQLGKRGHDPCLAREFAKPVQAARRARLVDRARNEEQVAALLEP